MKRIMSYYIKGVTGRGTDVIALLESKGGINKNNGDGECSTYLYYINIDNRICCCCNTTNNLAWVRQFCEELTLPKLEKWRPYNSAQEFLEAQKIHGPYLKVIDKHSEGYETYLLPIAIRGTWLDFNGAVSNDSVKHEQHTYNHLLGNYIWQDGHQCGILEKGI